MGSVISLGVFDRMKLPRMSTTWAGRLEGVLWLAVTALLVGLALLLASRAEQGLERYAHDVVMGQVVGQKISPQEKSMNQLWQEEVGFLVPEEIVSEQATKKSFFAKRADLIKSSALRLIGKIRWRAKASHGQPDAATLLAAHAARQDKRCQELLAAISAMNAGKIDFAPVSASYLAPSSGDALGVVPEKIVKGFKEERQEYGRRKKAVERLHPEAFLRAFEKYRARFQHGGNSKAQAEALRESALLLDGRKPREDDRTVERVLASPRIAQRATQATLLVRHGWWLWLGWSVWLWMAIQVGRRTERRPLAALGYLFGAAIIIAKGIEHWVGIIAPFGMLPWGLAFTAICLILDRLFRLDRLRILFGGLLTKPLPRRVGTSPWLLPGWLLFVGLSWLWLVDLSLNFHPRLRFLLVDHLTGVWGAILLLGLVPLFAPGLLSVLVRLLGIISSPRYRWRWPSVLALSVFVLLVWWGGKSSQYITGEVIKAVFVIFAAWFLVMRAPLLSHGRMVLRDFRDVSHALTPAMVVLGLLGIALIVTKDLGPLLVILLCSLLWGGAYWGLGISAMLISALFALILWAGKVLPTVGVRVQSLLDPFGASIDDLARLLWFQQEVPFFGFGLGNVPWRGYSFMEFSVGLPLQLQSDYTFTGLMGVFGVWAWLLVLLVACWGLELARSRAKKASIDTCSLMAGRKALREGFRAWLALVFGSLVSVQLALTVAGNLAWVPLTGITLPWMSFGNTALWVMTMFFALLVDVDKEDFPQ